MRLHAPVCWVHSGFHRLSPPGSAGRVREFFKPAGWELIGLGEPLANGSLQPAAYPPAQQAGPTAFPPPAEPVSFPPQPNYNNYNTTYNAQPQAVNYQAQTGYQTPVNMGTPNGIAVGTQYPAQTQGWRNGLFDCLDDPENALITACFPCITFGQIAEIVDNGQTSCATSGLIYGLIAAFIGCPCIMSCGYRTKIRNRYGLMETPAPDWATHCFCEWCALCQEYRELKAYGLDPAIGTLIYCVFLSKHLLYLSNFI
ncbi:hypothetical protein OSB04_014672 [Centaurea solstitialis]|uniref:Uncharacterized protein n=1 Tax=Centaurea solstitialis TaxID=347529 RepID=A0AA38W6N3_9ASTR|nr:hypothetical protein OSB04_014672 [Centaurea solstitialis]